MEKIVLRTARGQALFLVGGALAFVFGGVMIMVLDQKPKSFLLGLACVVFFGGCGLVGLRQLLDARPRVVLSDDGVFDRTLKVGVIPWADILDAHVAIVQGNPFIALRLRNTADYVARLGPVARRLVELNTYTGAATLNVNLVALQADPYQLAELIAREAEHRRGVPGGYRA